MNGTKSPGRNVVFLAHAKQCVLQYLIDFAGIHDSAFEESIEKIREGSHYLLKLLWSQAFSSTMAPN